MVLKSNIKLLLFLLLFIAAGIKAQNSSGSDVPAVSSGDIQFYIDHATFKGNDNKLLTEFYLMLFADQLSKKNIDGKNISEFSVKVTLLNSYGSEIKSQEWTTEASVSDSVSRADVIYDQWNAEINPGEYKLKFFLRDNNSGKKGEAEYPVSINKISDTGFTSSQIEFVSKIEESRYSDHFKKGNKSVVPNPSRRYGVLNPVLYVYYELYNLTTPAKLQVYYSIIGKAADTVKTFPPYELERNTTSSAIIHGLNTGNIPSGIYSLDVHVNNLTNNTVLDFSRRFEVIQKDYAQLKPELSDKEAEIFEWLLNIFGTIYQQKVYSQLTMNARAEFMVQFWKNLDPTPGTPENEELEKIQQRFLYANETFKWGETEGWKTERGRVLVQYGMPDEIERHHAEAGSLPYEIWHYTEARNFYFIFGDLRSDGRFVLLHSNKEGEVYNQRWQEYIRRM